MPWVINKLIVGWPPQAVLERTPGDKKALNTLFAFLGDKRLLLYGYGTRAGITDLDDLAQRVDAIRTMLFSTLTELRPTPRLPYASGNSKKRLTNLLTKIYGAQSGTDEAPPEPSDIAPAVDQLREAFQMVAAHLSALYKLPAAGNLADRIGEDVALPPAESS